MCQGQATLEDVEAGHVETPLSFPPTFLYTMPHALPGLLRRGIMRQVLAISKADTVLTLTSGGCNALNLLLHGAGHVVSVDCNPAQSALLELKATAIRCGMSAALGL